MLVIGDDGGGINMVLVHPPHQRVRQPFGVGLHDAPVAEEIREDNRVGLRERNFTALVLECDFHRPIVIQRRVGRETQGVIPALSGAA